MSSSNGRKIKPPVVKSVVSSGCQRTRRPNDNFRGFTSVSGIYIEFIDDNPKPIVCDDARFR